MAGSVSVLSLSTLYCNRAFHNAKPFSSFQNRLSFTCFSSKKKLGFTDQILDYIEGGPKLRKWYGAPDILENDGDELNEDEASEETVRDAVLVTDGDNEIGQMIILQLIVKRLRVKALVKDKRVAMEAFGAYVESLAGDPKEKIFLKKAFRGVRAVICPVEGSLYNIDGWKGVQNVILLSKLSVYRELSGIQAIMNSNARKLAEEDEDTVKASGVPYTIIRAGILKNTPGGQQGFCFDEGCASKGRLSKEDAAFICVEALDNAPQNGLLFEVVNGDEKVSDWKKCFADLIERST
ncbi:hypothetical protein SASPL_149936 [Salvia splendens]|uniref:NAD(P)-binding domain-containing protein n=1 Tax=Salvia splendens TaxID=180675 RepID=A0A8X8W5D6_SALSN|nr:uncharacterized sugar epimerase YhfK-like [Salvia splendens]KAG6388508.1 hypothetical protein SASPL_149936 [Salvia splendens]